MPGWPRPRARSAGPSSAASAPSRGSAQAGARRRAQYRADRAWRSRTHSSRSQTRRRATTSARSTPKSRPTIARAPPGWPTRWPRIYLESGNLQKAEQWYTTGYEMAQKIPGLPAAQAALWEMRWHNALGRIAARRGNRRRRTKHAAAAKAALDKGVNENQRPVLPVSARLHRVLREGLPDGDRRAAEGRPERSVRARLDRAVIPEAAATARQAAEYYRKVLAAHATASIRLLRGRSARAFLR